MLILIISRQLIQLLAAVSGLRETEFHHYLLGSKELALPPLFLSLSLSLPLSIYLSLCLSILFSFSFITADTHFCVKNDTTQVGVAMTPDLMLAR